MPLTNALNRLQDLRNENASNINPAKNQPINQAPKSAFKDLTNAKKEIGNILGNKPGSSFRTPQVSSKKDTKSQKEQVQIYMDDFCTSLPKQRDIYPELAWSAINTDKLAEKLSQPLTSDCLGYEVFKDDEFVLAPIEDPVLPEIPEMDFNFSVGEDSFKIDSDDFVLQPMKIDDLPDMDFTDFTFAL